MSEKPLREVKETKQDVYLEQSIKNNKRDSIEFFNNIYDAILNRDTDAAIGFIKHPGLINSSYADITSYTLHAILLVLANDDWTKIFTQMTNAQIKSLKNILKTVIWPTKAPKADVIFEKLKNVLGYKKQEGLCILGIPAKIKQLQGEDALQAKIWFVEFIVGSYWWKVSVEKKNLIEVLESFERKNTEQKNIVNTPNNEKHELWTTKQLAEKLGYKTTGVLFTMKSWLLKQQPERKDEIKSWFSPNGRLFHSEYFEKLKSLLQYDNLKTVAHSQKEQTKTMDLLDIKGFQTYLDGLQKIIDEKNEKTKNCKELISQAAEEEDSTKRKKLLEQASSINNAIEDSREHLESIENTLNSGKQLLETRNKAIEALNSVNAQITEFMKKPKLYQ